MRNLLAMQRQIQDLMQAQQNQERVGKVKEVKYDKDKGRWFVKFTSGEGDETINTDWVPWKSFAHGTIQASIPPRKDQNISLRSIGGQMEMAHAEPYHYDPDNKSPHDKEDEVFFRFNAPKKEKKDGEEGSKEGSGGGSGGSGGNGGSGGSAGADGGSEDKDPSKDPDQNFTMKFTKDGLEFNIGKTKLVMGAKGFKASHDKHSWEMTPEGIKSSVDDGKTQIDMTVGKIQNKVDDIKKTLDKSGDTQEGGYIKHDGKNIGKDHKHGNVMPGGGETGDPEA